VVLYHRRAARRAIVWLLATAFIAPLAATPPASAAASTYITGIVVDAGKPVTGATVVATGNNLRLTARTGAKGLFSFNGLAVGSYTVTATAGSLDATAQIDLTSSGATLTLEVRPKVIASVAVSRARQATLGGSGTDVTLNQTFLTRAPGAGSFPNLLIQLPGAARGANGVVHINGDHGDINYVVDGVAIPQELNRIMGTEFDPSNVGYAEILEGAYPAQYGQRFAAVVNINTRTGNGPPALNVDLEGGSYAQYDSLIAYNHPLGAGSLVLALRNGRTDRGLDPANFDSPHGDGSNGNQFLRVTLPNGTDYVNFTLTHSTQTYQIPVDVAGGQPAWTDDNERQQDYFGALQYTHSFNDKSYISFGPSYKRSAITDFNDAPGDFIYGINQNLMSGGTVLDCKNAFALQSTSACGFSVYDNRTAVDWIFNADYTYKLSKHKISAGGSYDASTIPKLYDISLQPLNYLAPLYTPESPDAAYTVQDNAPNVGHIESGYLQDAWKINPLYELDYGVRLDSFQIFSTQFDEGFSQWSPRIKFTRNFGTQANAYLYYGRFFTPFSFENVSPAAAYIINQPSQSAPAAFDLKPQRDSVYEIGGHFPLGRGDLGWRVMQKNATDLIDDTQVGLTNLHQDINYALGRIATQSLYYQMNLPRNGRWYLTFNHTYSVNKGCETQLLAPCQAGSATDWGPADHEQKVGATGGVLIDDKRNGWVSADFEYGSGLSTNPLYCPPAEQLFCKFTPHTTFDVEKGIGLGSDAAFTAQINNVLNDRYMVTFQNAQGNHYVAGRTFQLGFRFTAK
jgi:hypothetical protein